MALSGKIYTNVGSYWRLQLEWSATQSISDNTSRVTGKLYWMSLASGATISSSATKSGSISVGGSSSSFSGSGLASLSGNQKKLLKTFVKTVSHSADGKGSVTVDGYFDPEVTLSGTYYGRVSLSAKNFSLNTIPRASSLTSSSQASWTAGSNRTFGVSRASSSFTHKITIAVNGTTIKTLSNVGTSVSSSFSTTENTNIFKQLAQGSSKSTSITLETYSGSTKIGSKSYSGTVTAPSETRAKITNPTNVSVSGQGYSTVYIDQTINLDLPRANSAFTHTVKFKDGNSGSVVHTATGVGSSLSWTPSASEQTALYNKTPNAIEFDGQVDVYTYYNGVQVRSMNDIDINYRVRNSNPIFNGGMTYADTTAVPSGISKTSKQIIQGYSNVRVTIPASAKATAQNGATIKSYLVTLNGVQQSVGYNASSDVSKDMGTVKAGVNVTLSVRAVDSRGNTTEKTMSVEVIPYKKPALTKSAKRRNNFEDDVLIKLSGSVSATGIGNSLQYVRYRYKKKGTSSFGQWYDFTYTTAGSSFKATEAVATLDNTQSFDIEYYVSDKLGATSEVYSVASGKPIFFIDSKKRSLGVNKFPDRSDALEMVGTLAVDGSMLLNSKKVHSEGNLMVATGYALIEPLGDNKPTPLEISYGKTFPSTPRVAVVTNSTVAGTSISGWSATNIGTDSFRAWVTRSNTTTTGVHWIAVWEG